MTQLITIPRATLELVLRTINRLRYDNDSSMAEEGFHEAAEALRTALANAEPKPNIQNQIVKDISEKPCHACAHYQQGKRTGVSIHDETCYGCSEYYANKWEMK